MKAALLLAAVVLLIAPMSWGQTRQSYYVGSLDHELSWACPLGTPDACAEPASNPISSSFATVVATSFDDGAYWRFDVLGLSASWGNGLELTNGRYTIGYEDHPPAPFLQIVEFDQGVAENVEASLCSSVPLGCQLYVRFDNVAGHDWIHVIELVAVPEPSALALLGVLLGAGYIRRSSSTA